MTRLSLGRRDLIKLIGTALISRPTSWDRLLQTDVDNDSSWNVPNFRQRLEVSLSWLRDCCTELVAKARFVSQGFVFYYPVADGAAYPWFYLRDFTYMYESAPELFPAHEVRPVLELIFKKIRADGWVPERIALDGEPIYRCHGESDVIDSGLFLVKLVKAYADSTQDVDFVGEHLDALCQALSVLPVEEKSGLIWIDPQHPGTGYGFTDQIAKTGRELFCSLMLLEALNILKEWTVSFKKEDRRVWCEQKAARIRANLGLLRDSDSGMFFAASLDCHQLDVWGSIYACLTNAVSKEARERIVRWLALNGDRFEYRQQLRHLPEPEFWQRIIPGQQIAQGEFQNGAYWATPSGWYAEVLESEEAGKGAEFLCSLVQTFQEIGVWECIGRDGSRRNRGNLSSALLPYGSLKRIHASS